MSVKNHFWILPCVFLLAGIMAARGGDASGGLKLSIEIPGEPAQAAGKKTAPTLASKEPGASFFVVITNVSKQPVFLLNETMKTLYFEVKDAKGNTVRVNPALSPEPPADLTDPADLYYQLLTPGQATAVEVRYAASGPARSEAAKSDPLIGDKTPLPFPLDGKSQPVAIRKDYPFPFPPKGSGKFTLRAVMEAKSAADAGAQHGSWSGKIVSSARDIILAPWKGEQD